VEHAALLGVRREHPLLLERLTVYDDHDEPVEYTETRYVGDRYEFDIKLGRMPDSAHGSA
jgi:DNA-binding GntR family transcriptional regulator